MKLLLLLVALVSVGYFGFKFSNRYTVTGAGNFKDGGTTCLYMKSSDGGETIVLCIDKRIGTKTPGSIYEGADYPSHKDATRVSKERSEQLIEIIKSADVSSLEPSDRELVDKAVSFAVQNQ